MLLLLVYVGIAVGVSFLCSLLEATLLSIRSTALIEQRDRGNRGAGLLLELKEKRLDDSISAILTLNTISHTIGAALAGAQAATLAHEYEYGAHETLVVGIFSGVLTLLILTLSEIVPKTLGAVYAAPLSGFVGRTLDLLVKLCRPILGMTRALTRMATHSHAEKVSRGEVHAFLQMAGGQGALAEDEVKWHGNLLSLSEIPVGDVLTPRTVLQMLREDSTIADLVAAKNVHPFSRVPLYRGTRDDIVGYVYQRDVYQALAQGAAVTTSLKEFERPVHFIPETVSVRHALRELLRRKLHFALIVDEHGGVDGLVSFEDLTETLFGAEVVDEADRVTNMRELAAQLRDKRLARFSE